MNRYRIWYDTMIANGIHIVNIDTTTKANVTEQNVAINRAQANSNKQHSKQTTYKAKQIENISIYIERNATLRLSIQRM